MFDGFLQSTEFAGFCKEAGIVVGDPIPYAPAKGCSDGNHDMHDTVTKAPTCVDDGLVTSTCSRCGYSYTQYVPYTAEHQYVTTVVQPDCTKKGYTEYKCTVCGYNFRNNYVDAEGHDFKTTALKEATCIMTGRVEHTCSKCGYSYTEATSTNGGNHNYVTTVVAPTDTEIGYTQHRCSWCGRSYYTDYTDPVGHSKGAVVKVVSPSREGQGYTVYKCSTCGQEITADYKDFQPTEAQVYSDMMALQSKYPEGMHWTNENSYFSEPMYCVGYGCHAFALILSDEAFGYLPGREHTDFSRIRVGDMLRINNDTHTVIVLEVNSDNVVVAEGNYNSSIHWGRVISRAALEETGDYVTTRYPE